MRPHRTIRPGRFRFPQSIRFRLTVMYSTVLFGLAALALGAVYLDVSAGVDAQPIETRPAQEVVVTDDGERVYKGTVPVADVRQLESNVAFQTLRTLRGYAAWALGGLFAASLGVGWVLSGRALRPVRDLARATEGIRATDLSRRIELPGPPDELRQLAGTIDAMLDRLQDAFDAQRRLLDDTSHELRTPLAIIRANLDAAVTAPDVSETERRRAVAVIDRATTRMSHLVDDLLAAAGRATPACRDADVDLAGVAREAGEEFAALAAGRGVTLRYRLDGTQTVTGDHDALRRAVGNLLSNAVGLAPPGSEIVIGTGRAGSWRWVAVQDQGPGIAPGEQDRVFDRFWLSRTGLRGARDRHAGLGLAIVRQIAEAHRGHVRLFSRPGSGSTFVVWLPGPSGNAARVPGHNPLLAAGR